MRFEQLESVSRSHAVRDQLLAAINRGDFRPGDRLPSEGVLVSEFGVSRSSIRQALRSLETMGLIEIRHGRGSFVARGPGERYLSPFASWLNVHRDQILDLMKVRGALDELAAAEAASCKNTELVEKVATAERRFAAAAKGDTASVEDLVRLDIEFHNSIAEASESSLLPHLLGDLQELFSESRRAAFALNDRAGRSAVEHAAIVRAIRSGNPVRARAAAARHLESTRRSLSDPSFLSKLAQADPAFADDVKADTSQSQ